MATKKKPASKKKPAAKKPAAAIDAVLDELGVAIAAAFA